QRMPVGFGEGRERPRGVLAREPTQHVGILGDIARVVVTDEVEAEHLGVDRERQRCDPRGGEASRATEAHCGIVICDRRTSMTSRAALWIGAVCIQLCFAGLVFAGLGSPLFWYDEGETAMLGRRILEYGYPKVHGADGNVVYGARHPISLGVDPRLDAYLGS